MYVNVYVQPRIVSKLLVKKEAHRNVALIDQSVNVQERLYIISACTLMHVVDAFKHPEG